MSKINIKIDFKDGEKLFGSQLNNNFKVIMEALNNNDAVLAENIATAKAELKSELDAITANRGWDWDGDGNPRVTYKRAMTTAAVEDIPIVDGQILASGEGATFIDYKGTRLIQYDEKYQIIQKDSRGNVLGAVRGTQRPIWAVLPDENIKKVG